MDDLSKTVSYSKMARFVKCPYSYNLHYVERIKPRARSVNLFFGSAIHDTLAAWYDNENLDAQEYFKAHWEEVVSSESIDFGKQDPLKMEELGLKILSSYKPIIKKDFKQYEVVAIEQPFLVKTELFEIEGIIDLILKDKKTGEYVIIDHKCLGKKMNEDNAKIDLQFTFYVAGARSLGYDVSKCYLNALYKTKEGGSERIATERTDEQVASLYEEVYEVVQIKDQVKYKSRSYMCNGCDFFQWCLGNRENYWIDKMDGGAIDLEDVE